MTLAPTGQTTMNPKTKQISYVSPKLWNFLAVHGLTLYMISEAVLRYAWRRPCCHSAYRGSYSLSRGPQRLLRSIAGSGQLWQGQLLVRQRNLVSQPLPKSFSLHTIYSQIIQYCTTSAQKERKIFKKIETIHDKYGLLLICSYYTPLHSTFLIRRHILTRAAVPIEIGGATTNLLT